MSAVGELPLVDYAIHADTTHEAAGTYSHAAKWTPWLESHGVKVRTVTADRTGDVEDGESPSALIPAFTTDNRSGKPGQVRRQCTHDWKIMPIRRFIRTVIGKPTPGAVESWQGISLDEWQRMRDSDVGYISNEYPLVERKITRGDCVAWLETKGLDVPPKSACTFCPYHSIAQWKRLKREDGTDWRHAVEVDTAIRHKRSSIGHLAYVHPYRKPLPEAVRIPEDVGASQLEMDLETPCDGGMCFV